MTEGESRTLITTCMHAHTPVAAHTHTYTETHSPPAPARGYSQQQHPSLVFSLLYDCATSNHPAGCCCSCSSCSACCCWFCYVFFSLLFSLVKGFQPLSAGLGECTLRLCQPGNPQLDDGGPACRPQPSRLYLLSFN